MKLIIGQIGHDTDLDKLREVAARVNNHGIHGDKGVQLEHAVMPPFSWAVGLTYESGPVFDRTDTKAMTFLTEVVRALGDGTYYARGFQYDPSYFYDKDPVLINSVEIILYGLPLMLTVNGGQVTVHVLWNWINEFVGSNPKGMMERNLSLSAAIMEESELQFVPALNKFMLLFEVVSHVTRVQGKWDFSLSLEPERIDTNVLRIGATSFGRAHYRSS